MPLNPYKKGDNPALVINPEVAGEEVTFYYLGDGTETRVIVKGLLIRTGEFYMRWIMKITLIYGQ